MLTTDMRMYEYFTYGDKDAYGQPQLSTTPSGTTQMVINTISQSIQDNIRYKDASYLGLTLDSTITDGCVIQYENEKLKVLYVNPKGRYKQVFMKNI